MRCDIMRVWIWTYQHTDLMSAESIQAINVEPFDSLMRRRGRQTWKHLLLY